MLLTYLLFFLSGVFGANGVPHFIKGITGERHMTPFSKPSGPMFNVIWGTANFVVAYLMFSLANDKNYSVSTAAAAIFTGILLTSILLAALWEDDDRAKGRDKNRR